MVSLWLLVLLAACSIATASSSWTLSSKNIIVTGGTKGIGKAIVEECSELGGCVLTCGRNEEELQSCQAAWQEKGYKTCSIVAGSTPLLCFITKYLTE